MTAEAAKGGARAEASSRSMLGAAGTAALAGIALCVADQQTLGGWIVIGSLALMLFALHRFGRSGADAPVRKRKKAKKREG